LRSTAINAAVTSPVTDVVAPRKSWKRAYGLAGAGAVFTRTGEVLLSGVGELLEAHAVAGGPRPVVDVLRRGVMARKPREAITAVRVRDALERRQVLADPLDRDGRRELRRVVVVRAADAEATGTLSTTTAQSTATDLLDKESSSGQACRGHDSADRRRLGRD